MNDQSILQYRLRQLIDIKYPDKYSLGIILVSQWLIHGTGNASWTPLKVERMCQATFENTMPLFKKDAEVLQQLFGLKSYVELFTIPETSTTPLS